MVATLEKPQKRNEAGPSYTQVGETSKPADSTESRSKRGRNNSDPIADQIINGPDTKRVQRVIETIKKTIAKQSADMPGAAQDNGRPVIE